MNEPFDLQAQLIKSLANPQRLRVLNWLRDGEKTASDLVRLTGLSKPNISQHVNRLKQEGLVLCDKRGTFCHYRIADLRLIEALELLCAVLDARTAAPTEVVDAFCDTRKKAARS